MLLKYAHQLNFLRTSGAVTDEYKDDRIRNGTVKPFNSPSVHTTGTKLTETYLHY
jgi:hypothetical protein